MEDLANFGVKLANFMGARLAPVRVLASGWETTVFEFALNEPSPRMPSVKPGTPLVLRLYNAGCADEKGPREFAVMRAVAAAGLPVPDPYLFVPSTEVLGSAFLIMRRLEGTPMFEARSFPAALRLFSLGFAGFVRIHAALHKIDPARWAQQPHALASMAPSAEGETSLLDRMLELIGTRIRDGPLPGLAAAHRRLIAQAAQYRSSPQSIVHLDYHPQNVLVLGTRVSGVIDWVNADIGDRHLDVATTATILATHTMENPFWMRANAAGNSLRRLFSGLYVALYHLFAPLDFRRLRYCQAVTALMRLSTFGIMLTQGPPAAGFRPEAITHITPSVVKSLSRYARLKCGEPVSL
jgi:aminoglycoside phosphotransferase (APT) family kinase protein